MTAPLRRWPRFSLRTLFVVVTAFGCWLGWEFRIARQRQRVRAEFDDAQTEFMPWQEFQEMKLEPTFGLNDWKEELEAVTAPSKVLWIFGDESVGAILIPDYLLTNETTAVLRRTFPESVLWPILYDPRFIPPKAAKPSG